MKMRGDTQSGWKNQILYLNAEVESLWLSWPIHTCEVNIEVKEAEADAAARNADKRDKQATFKKMHSIY